MPWRETLDPYKIWLSEIILQQTRVAQGTPYYLEFVSEFPTVHHLATAPEEKVLKLWQGLGYYSRARNLHAAAKYVVSEHGGVFPNNHKELLKLKGVGDYTASAIASICFGEPQAVLDGNVYRVLARYFGVETAINTGPGTRYFRALAQEVMAVDEPRDYNQGIMEFGAVQCKPKKPYCLHCPLNDSCVALKEGRVEALPVKLKKGKIRKRHFNYIVPIMSLDNGGKGTLLEQRKGKGIWQGLWEFPLIEATGPVDSAWLLKQLPNALSTLQQPFLERANATPVVHKLSHQHLYTTFWTIRGNGQIPGTVPLEKTGAYPVPVLIADFLKTLKF